MSDLIRREDAVEAIYEALRTPLPNYNNDFFHDSMSLAIAMAKNIPSAEPERTAKITLLTPNSKGYWSTNGRCQGCGFLLERKHTYCPNCGARLEWE